MAIHIIEPAVPYDSNIYLLTGDRNVMIDTGTGVAHEHTASEIRRIIGSGKLDEVILTHCHFDHVGGVAAVTRDFGADVWAGEFDAPFVREADSHYTLDSMFGGRLHPQDVGGLSEGDVMDIGDHRLRVIWTPGHTEGGICLYDEVTHALFSGDTLFLDGVGRTDFPGGSYQKLGASLRKISNIDIRGLYPGHGNVSQDHGSDYLSRGLRLVGEGN